MSDKSTDEVVDSPCIRHCCLDDKDICVGCFRTLSEILVWSKADTTLRRKILARCEQRKLKRLPFSINKLRSLDT
ncbi:DUF1289 domain-containing protein [Pseudoalteromonas sp. JBTF-M23]|uniref:DUF1289 domain-containing protein n=1 Tax=Pseudoalteromonas caenipelagi TaxID=2726988 RepID=A0A849VCI3_9GAMM|nr:DUF1289 domain-containing protein [Pseudoalteromonas caenipelagi]NOU49401.1 DUF1289 domain-containing protein [Pseudoalteromonas caenipelagi]